MAEVRLCTKKEVFFNKSENLIKFYVQWKWDEVIEKEGLDGH
ncbi:hypothetical protein P799_00790 [Lysinibacillus sphaericus CBAM5]|uniref:Uncharacterized protein n=1 Tax=Lysinibacillus sphaericus CBAM5 TaxID=1400869 RepID=W7S5Y6_LYSSH|nr:hypothetical protein P799_00790 [Lysinibacillus sphaericus CBAM5]